ncbi:MAG: hypothetical protein WCR36_04665, partial [Bacteroidaceae bacterium]
MARRKTNVVLRVLVWVFLTPILVVSVIMVALYVPAIQQLAKDKIATTISETLGQTVTIGRIDLTYPLDLTISNITILEKDIQRAHLAAFRLQINVLPLIKKEISIDEISLSDASFNQFVPLEGVTLSGNCNKVQLVARSISLDREIIAVNRALIRQANLNVSIGVLKTDTAKTDTIEPHWKLFFKQIMTEDSKIVLSMPDDSLALDIAYQKFEISNTNIQLNPFSFNIPQAKLQHGQFFYGTHLDSLYILPTVTFKDIDINIDSLNADSVGLSLANLKIKVDSSWVCAKINSIGPWQDVMTWAEPQKMVAELDADIQKNLLLHYWPDSTQLALRPEQNLLLSFRLEGRNKQILVNRAAANCSPLFNLTINGTVSNILHEKNRRAVLVVNSSLPEKYDLKSHVNLLSDSLSLDLVLNQKEIIPIQSSIISRTDTIYKMDAVTPKILGTDSILKENLALVEQAIKGVDSTVVSVRKQKMRIGSTRKVATLLASYQFKKQNYSLDFDVDSLVLQTFFPNDSLKCITTQVKAQGTGIDLFDKKTYSQITGHISSFRYGSYNVQDVSVDAAIIDAMAEVNIESRWEEFQFHADGNYELHKDEAIRGTVNLNVLSADLYRLGLLDQPTAKPLVMDLQAEAAKDTLWLSLYSGDAMLSLYAGISLEKLIYDGKQVMKCAEEMKQSFYLDYDELLPKLPMTNVALYMGKENVIAWWLRQKHIYFEQAQFEASTEPNWGLDADGLVQNLRFDSIRIDSLQLLAQQDDRKLNYRLSVTDNHVNHPERDYKVLLEGMLEGRQFDTRLYYNDYKHQKGLDFGVSVQSKDSAFYFKVFPEEPIIAFRKFQLK